MASIVRLRITWSGTPVVGGGLTVLHFAAGSTTGPGAALSFFDGIKGLIPSGVTITIPNAGDTIDELTGEIDGVWTASGGGTVNSAGGANPYAQGVGARVVWVTDGITRGRRVRGSTFVVPLITGSYDTDGTLSGTAVGALGTVAGNLASVAAFGVYTRPQSGTSNGAFHDVLTSITPDRVSWLRSRRT